MTSYHQLSKIAETRYGGAEYTPELPNSIVASSPGGLDTSTHYHTGGVYGSGNSSSNHYGMNNPSYLSGIYGNVYEKGHSASIKQGYYPPSTDDIHWKTTERYTPVELIPLPTEASPTPKKKIGKLAMGILFFLFLIAAMYWASAIKNATSSLLFNGKKLSWQVVTILATIFTLIFGIGIWMAKDSLPSSGNRT